MNNIDISKIVQKVIGCSNILNNTVFFKRCLVYCLLFAVIVQSSNFGVVLCFERDGGVEIEFGSNEQCCQPFNRDLEESSIFVSKGDYGNNHCGICVDFPLYITAKKSNCSGSVVLEKLIVQLQTQSYSIVHIDQSLTSSRFSILSSTGYCTPAFQTVVQQV